MRTPDLGVEPFDGDADASAVDASAERRKPRRALLIGALCTAIALVVGGAVAATALVPADGAKSENTRLNAETVSIERGTLAGTVVAQGTLAYADQRTISSVGAGVVTALPPAGAPIALGGQLYAVDNRPVVLMRGVLPAWRPFESGMGDGPDVRQLEESLAALGYFEQEPDERFSWRTKNAIERWQKETGQKQTGTIGLESLVFLPGDVRVASLQVAVGDQSGGPVLTVTSTEKRVDVDLKLADQSLGVVGTVVEVNLPGGTTTTGTVTDVGVPTERDQDGKKAVVIPVVISLDDPAAADAVQQANVTIGFPSERREDVFSVPVDALLALDGESFGVEIVGSDGVTHRRAVQTGLYAAGRVEISGDGIEEGQKVVVPKR